MPLPLLHTAFPVPGAATSGSGTHPELDSGYAVPTFVTAGPGTHPEIDSGYATPEVVDNLKSNTVTASADVSDSGAQGESDVREPFACASLRQSYLVGRSTNIRPVEGVVIHANPVFKRTLPSVADQPAYAMIITDVLNFQDDLPRETDKIPRFRVAGNRGRRGGQP